jgi:hypothetical protein
MATADIAINLVVDAIIAFAKVVLSVDACNIK